ncbi:hypothetical protein [Helicobacter sp. MIT 99-5507]|uniref:hypothetical protein n=1 Tax=Helicobacter sp. MIT 99-5507 TaxID=152489 RepID=UPI000E1EC607|nr:hypothetical protein [Helicobacter sp. MIT 99-5507]RDU58416.1 hypothetical protein CQA42_01095 [Helicobacter sp. MIT 99-5507]
MTSYEESIRNSHILISGSNDGKLTMANDGKIILSFGDGFELGQNYNSKYIFLDCDGNGGNNGSSGNNDVKNCALKNNGKDVIPFLTTYNNGLFSIKTNGGDFSININDDEYASINTIYKSALLSMNTYKTIINNIINNSKTFTNENKNTTTINNINARSDRRRALSRNIESEITNDKKDSTNYMFFLPLVSYQSINGGGGYNGLNYGFVGGYNAAINNNLAGIHFGFTYGGIESKSSNLIQLKNTSYSALLGFHYKYNFNYNLYISTRLEAFYYINNLKGYFNNINYETLKPTTFAPSINFAFGKKWHFYMNKIGVEGGFDYSAMINSSLDRLGESYAKNLLNLAYLDINGNYELALKYFKFHFLLGAKTLITPYPKATLNTSNGYKINIYENRISAYTSIGTTYQLNDIIALELNYLGIYGDRMINHSGFFNTKIWW